MPTIKSNAELHNNYYENLKSRYELYGLIKEGIDDINQGNTRPFSEAMMDLKRHHAVIFGR